MPTQVPARNWTTTGSRPSTPSQVQSSNSPPPQPSGTTGAATGTVGVANGASGTAASNELGDDEAVVDTGLADPNRLLLGVAAPATSDLGISFRQKGEMLSSKSSLQAIHRRPLQCAWLHVMFFFNTLPDLVSVN